MTLKLYMVLGPSIPFLRTDLDFYLNLHIYLNLRIKMADPMSNLAWSVNVHTSPRESTWCNKWKISSS